MLVLLILVFILFAHWFACIWYSIGNTELNSGVTYGWLQTLAAVTKQPFKPSNTSASSDYTEGPSTEMRYLTALYFTLSCMTGVGFGNVSANTQTEKLFSVFMMIIGCKLCTGSFFFLFSLYLVKDSVTYKNNNKRRRRKKSRKQQWPLHSPHRQQFVFALSDLIYCYSCLAPIIVNKNGRIV